ncbi:hypothetical protein B7P43_G08275 [Cryptotermes secundus]|uniref:START domain-containing protein n=1 Tax=Cryptotermes secundus TaxID=105785 RepID=A0A2J7RH71_9NEOP|nr:hypothetical protein B7P43_G08275 [Cryptotermes secundus]
MYYNSLPRIPFSSRPISTVLRAKYFLFSKCYFLGSKFQAQVLKFYSALMINTPSTVTVHDYHTSRCMHARDTLLWYFKQGVQRFPLSLKEQSVQIVRVCTQQCEWVLAHRIRRGQQIFSLYSKLWDEVALKELMKKMRHQLSRRGKEFLLTAAGMSVFNWEEERIPDEEVLGHLNELEAVYKLCDYTITCRQCRKRMVVDAPLPSIDYCKCSHKTHCFEKDVCGWKPFLEREDLLVWRKEDEVFHGLYVYKVYGKYHDVAAKDFLKVQIDTDFRKTWDNTAINLKVVEQDSASNSDIVYWEMKWPVCVSLLLQCSPSAWVNCTAKLL